jgi:hypothetical protein
MLFQGLQAVRYGHRKPIAHPEVTVELKRAKG